MDPSGDNLKSKHYSLAIDALSKAVSDTEKFGALFVVSKVLKDICLSDQQNRQLFQSINPKFLCRLLSTDGQSVPEGCPQNIYQSIGVSILSSFFIRIANDIDVKTSFQLISSMVSILKQLKDKEQDLDENECQIITDIIVCFQCFFSSKRTPEMNFPTQKSLFETNLTQILFEIQSNDRFSDYKNSIQDVLLKISMTIEWSNFNPLTFDAFMSSLAEEFNSNKDKKKFEFCQTFNAIITKNRNHLIKQRNNTSIDSISDTIFGILRNKLSKELRDPVIGLAATLTETYNGFNWISSTNGWNENNCKHFLILLRLSCIEIAINFESEDIDMSCVANSFVILEHSVTTVANDSEDMFLLKHFSQQQMYDMLTAIRDTMSVIIRYLQRFKDQSLDFNVDSDVVASILASIRVLFVWVTEETEALREEIADILPFILKVFKISFKNSLSINKLFVTALICLADNQSLKSILLDENLIQFLDSLTAEETNDLLIKELKTILMN